MVGAQQKFFKGLGLAIEKNHAIWGFEASHARPSPSEGADSSKWCRMVSANRAELKSRPVRRAP